MAAPFNFRSAFNGFNREDVVHYIEYLNAKHTAEVNELNAEADFLRSKLSGAQDEAAPEVSAQTRQELTDCRRELEELKQRCAALEKERDDALASAGDMADSQVLAQRCAALETEVASLQSAAQGRTEEELAAYRRAERTERIAQERAEQVYRQANGALADATARVDEAAAQLGGMTDRVSAQLAALQNAVSESKQALADAASRLYSIRPDGQ